MPDVESVKRSRPAMPGAGRPKGAPDTAETIASRRRRRENFALSPRRQLDVRKQIRVGHIIGFFQDVLDGKFAEENSAHLTQRIKAGEILLRKCLPDLTSVEGKIDVKEVPLSPVEIARSLQYGLAMLKRRQAQVIDAPKQLEVEDGAVKD